MASGMESRINFFVGKGGVGKSTVSALAAICAAGAGKRTLLVSMDPAHNQGDIFCVAPGNTQRKVSRNLYLQEIDTDQWQKRYLEEIRSHIRKTYLYETAFNLQDHFNVLRFSPGLEEYAMAMAFEHVLENSSGMDMIMFDMAPTALSLRFFALPGITLAWLEQLLKLRRLICDKKKIVSRIKLGKREYETKDRVSEKLESLIERHTRLQERLAKGCAVNLVMNPDPLSLAETERIYKRLADIGIGVSCVVINKAGTKGAAPGIPAFAKGLKVTSLPVSGTPLIGMNALTSYAGDQAEALRVFYQDKDRGGTTMRRFSDYFGHE